jgi:hypothetical protein
MSQSAGCTVVRCPIGSRCRSTFRNSDQRSQDFEVTTAKGLVERVFPFFDRFPLRGAKRHDLERFHQITVLIQSGRHLTRSGFEEILLMRSPMNRGGKRRRSDDELVADLRSWNPQRPYARLPLEAEG